VVLGSTATRSPDAELYMGGRSDHAGIGIAAGEGGFSGYVQELPRIAYQHPESGSR
jgi:hypothetical protein